MISKYKEGYKLVENRIEILLEQQKRKCTNKNCQKMFENCKRKCDVCGFPVQKQHQINDGKHQTSKDGEKYIDLGENKNINFKYMSIGEPILLNPNSFTNIENILDTLKENICKEERKWTIVGADGPPYCIASRIIDKEKEKYDWVSMVPGLGKEIYISFVKFDCYFVLSTIERILTQGRSKRVTKKRTKHKQNK